jgi:class 3 adenylate cyclase
MSANTASRMESHAPPGAIQVTQRTYDRLRDRYELRLGGTIDVKGKGPLSICLLIGPARTKPHLRALVRSARRVTTQARS